MTYRGPSESQSNAEALARRGSPYTAASDMSMRIAWDHRRREPDNLRDAVRMVRRAYSDEVPTKLHEGYDSIGEGGTPKMTARAEGYIFGNPQADDSLNSRTGERDLAGWHFTPFRAALDRMAHGSDSERVYAAIVSKVTIGGQGPKEAAIAAGQRPECLAGSVALMALRAFLRSMTDLKLHVREEVA